MTEVIRRALAAYDTLLTSVREDGATIIVRNADGTERELLLT